MNNYKKVINDFVNLFQLGILTAKDIKQEISNIIQFKKEKNISGFTVQIEVSQQTNIIKDARLKFIKAFPDYPIFDEYIAPNTYLFVGRFYDKNNALAFQHKIKSKF